MADGRLPLWEWRAKRRLSKTALAMAAGVSRNTVADIESGKQDSPNVATMRKIAGVFDLTWEDIDWGAGKRERDAKTLAPVA